ncbi:MAG: DUF418 domain-containing protein [Pseudomonadota bacterium]
MVAPAHPGTRIAELDALRGLAVIGIAWMNVYVFALPVQAYYNPEVWGPGTQGVAAIDRLVWVISFVFIEDKFRTLFAMLFGAGCLILLERTKDKPWRAHFARMAVLFAIGLAHAILLASNDVLRAYAIAGLAIPLIAQLSARALYAIAIGLVSVHVGAGIVAFGSGVVDFYGGRLGSDAALFAERNYGRDPAAIQYSLELGREMLGERIVRRLESIPAQLTAVAASLPLNLAAMALGMGFWKDRMLAADWRTFRLQRLAAVCAVLSIPPLLWLAWWLAGNGFPGQLVGPAALVLSAPFDTLLGVAYAALAMALFGSGAVTRQLAAVGRLSLTNYLLTSVVFAGIFASWGFGLFGEVSRAQALALTFVPTCAVLLWSPPWLGAFGQGPFERLWRKASALLG